MERGPSYSSSKVTVEYHDPAGVFPLLSSQLQARLPLKKLHWKSNSRPLRSIDSLHVELVPGDDGIVRPSTAASQDSVVSHESHRNSQTNDGVMHRPAHGLQQFKPFNKERRHQIPGLRRTPYLKIYFLRCDDGDTYKSVTRKLIRDWVRSNTPSPDTKNHSAQEKHDAFEWMIVHVTLPNTLAAAQPRFSGSANSSTGTAKDRSTSTRWPGGKSTTIFEKIRSDFNSTNSQSPDRVAQIRVHDGEPELSAQDEIPLPVVIPQWQESEQERAEAWNDLISKLKTLILGSFDLRVAQYEDDIREKEAQRTLPGWNFCTFFPLKEGLAQSFEGVGLVEDALVIYDELALGLDKVIRDKAVDRSGTDATSFPESTKELEVLLSKLSEDDVEQDSAELTFTRPIREAAKPYREMIISSNISVFDFRCYLFSRQIALLSRLARREADLLPESRINRTSQEARRNSFDAVLSRTSIDQVGEDELGVLAEICHRSLSFVSSVARDLRQDLEHSANSHGGEEQQELIPGLVASWKVAAIEQILIETETPSIEALKLPANIASSGLLPLKSQLPQLSAPGNVRPANVDSANRPSRSSSLANRPSSGVESGVHQPANRRSLDAKGSNEVVLHPGFVALCANRARLHLYQRRTLEQVGATFGWDMSWSALLDEDAELGNILEVLENRRLEYTSNLISPEESTTAKARWMRKAYITPSLARATEGSESFRRAYNKLTEEAMSLQSVTAQTRAIEQSLADLALSRFYAGDYAEASTLLGRITSSFADCKWNHIEVTLLLIHAKCLKAVKRKDDYVRSLLQVLSKTVARRNSAMVPISKPATSPGMRKAMGSTLAWLNDESVPAGGILEELLSYSSELPYEVSVPLKLYLFDIAVDPFITHREDRDGFCLQLSFRHVLQETFFPDLAQVRLVATSSDHKRDITLETEGRFLVKPGTVKCTLYTNVTTFGIFMVEQIVLKANNVCFIQEPLSQGESALRLRHAGAARLEAQELSKRSTVLCYPRLGSLGCKAQLARHISVTKSRSIEVEIASGLQTVSHAALRFRAGSAGLRIETLNAATTSGSAVLISDSPKPGIVKLGSMSAGSISTIQVPFSLEAETSSISLRLEVDYVVEGRQYQFFSNTIVPIELPFDVNVQDAFKHSSLQCTFNVRTSSSFPILMLEASMSNSAAFVVQGPMGGLGPRIVLPDRNTCLRFLVERDSNTQPKPRETLALNVQYEFLNERVKVGAEAFITTLIERSNIAQWSRLVVPSFTEKLTHLYLNADHLANFMYDEFDLPSFESFGWDETLEAVAPQSREAVSRWLQSMHSDHTKFSLNNVDDQMGIYGSASNDPDLPKSTTALHLRRQITIPVSVPKMHIVSTATLRVRNYDRRYVPTDPTWLIGQTRMATLSVMHTRRWASVQEVKEAAGLDAADSPIPFSYEIVYNPEVWLVGGATRGKFWQKEGSDATFEVELLLIPLKKGQWATPTVSVQPMHTASDEEQRQARTDISTTMERQSVDAEMTLSSECCLENAFEQVLVVPGVKSTTVGLTNNNATVLLATGNVLKA